MIDRVQAKENARAIMKERLGSAVGADLLSTLFSLVPFAGNIAGLGLCTYYLRAVDNERPKAYCIFEGFDNALRAIGLGLWQALFLLLWTIGPALILVILGAIFHKVTALMVIFFLLAGLCALFMFIYKDISYGLAFYVLADMPQMTIRESLRTSIELTKGHIWELFVVRLSFLGWLILNSYTANLLALFWLTPYMRLTWAGIFRQLTGPRPQGAGVDNRSGAGPAPAAGAPAPSIPGPAQTATVAIGSGAAVTEEPGLRGVAGMYAGFNFKLNPGETITLGRDANSAQIVISDHAEKVSRTHCRVSFDTQQALYIVTDVSKNGTYLQDGTQLPPQRPNRVARGTVICLGDSSNSFRLV